MPGTKRNASTAGMRYVSGSRSMKKRVRRAPQAPMYKQTVEVKYADRGAYNTSATTSGAVVCVHNSLTRGDDAYNNFDGNTIYPLGLSFKWGTQTNQNFNYVRFVLFQWLENTTPTASDLLQDTTTGIATLSAFNVNTKGRMTVLYDKIVTIAPSAAGGSTATVLGDGIKNGKVYIPGSRLAPIRYRVGSTDIISGGIFLLYISDDNVPTYPGISYYSRLAFKD